METFKNILVVSRSTKNCPKVLHMGISLARKFGSDLTLLHAIYDPYYFSDYSMVFGTLEKELRCEIEKTQEELDQIIQTERAEGMNITKVVEHGRPVEEIFKVVEEKNIDLILILAHEEGRLEHFLFGRTNEAIIRKLPATVMLVK